MASSPVLKPHDTTAPQFLDTRAAARLLGISPATLQTWRCRSAGGPRFRRVGPGARLVRYALGDLLAFAEARPAMTSTGDVAA